MYEVIGSIIQELAPRKRLQGVDDWFTYSILIFVLIISGIMLLVLLLIFGAVIEIMQFYEAHPLFGTKKKPV